MQRNILNATLEEIQELEKLIEQRKKSWTDIVKAVKILFIAFIFRKKRGIDFLYPSAHTLFIHL